MCGVTGVRGGGRRVYGMTGVWGCVVTGVWDDGV